MEKGHLVYRVKTRSGVRDINLTFCTVDDLEIQQVSQTKLRQYRLLRLVAESREQGVPLGYRDLSLLLLSSPATLKRDVQEMRRMGIDLHVGQRGALKEEPYRGDSLGAGAGV